MEEALETIQALGIKMRIKGDAFPISFDIIVFEGLPTEPDLEKIIDGCCDTEYVCKGTLAACGVPDKPHLAEVNRANAAKFPGGVGITNEHGKYQKPPGWTPPHHHSLMGIYCPNLDLAQTTENLLQQVKILGHLPKAEELK